LTCNSGYSKNSAGTACVLDTPSGEPCTSSQTRSCTISHGTGQQTRQCINGYYLSWSSCTVLTCNSGYVKNSAGTACIISGSPPVTGEGLYAGTAEVDITCPIDQIMGGYGGIKRCTTIHDNLYARVLVLQNGDTSIAIVAVDLLLFGSDYIINQAKQLYGLDSVILSSAHNHAGPIPEAGGMYELYDKGSNSHDASLSWSRSLERSLDWDEFSEDPWHAEVESKIINAIGEASNNLFPATLSVGKGTLNSQYMSQNRRYVVNGVCQMDWNDYYPNTGPEDETVGVIRVYDSSGNTRSMIVNYACHAVYLDDGNRQISGEFPGAMARYIENQIPGCVPLFVNGAAGDIDPYYRSNTAFTSMKNGGEDLAKKAISISTQQISSGLIEIKNSLLQFQDRWHASDGPHYAGITTVVLGDTIAFVTVAGEMFVEHQINLRSQSPLSNTFLFGYSYNGQGDHYLLYLPTIKAAGDKGDNYGGNYVTYLEIGAGEKIVQEGLNSINQLF